jgi:hypothetical protein
VIGGYWLELCARVWWSESEARGLQVNLLHHFDRRASGCRSNQIRGSACPSMLEIEWRAVLRALTTMHRLVGRVVVAATGIEPVSKWFTATSSALERSLPGVRFDCPRVGQPALWLGDRTGSHPVMPARVTLFYDATETVRSPSVFIATCLPVGSCGCVQRMAYAGCPGACQLRPADMRLVWAHVNMPVSRGGSLGSRLEDVCSVVARCAYGPSVWARLFCHRFRRKFGGL